MSFGLHFHDRIILVYFVYLFFFVDNCAAPVPCALFTFITHRFDACTKCILVILWWLARHTYTDRAQTHSALSFRFSFHFNFIFVIRNSITINRMVHNILKLRAHKYIVYIRFQTVHYIPSANWYRSIHTVFNKSVFLVVLCFARAPVFFFLLLLHYYNYM